MAHSVGPLGLLQQHRVDLAHHAPLIVLLQRPGDGLGGGDPFLFAGAGAWVGWMGLPSVLLWACAVSLALVFVMLMGRRNVPLSQKLPFGVFLAVGIWMTWLYGPLGL